MNYFFTIRDYTFIYNSEYNYNVEFGKLINKYNFSDNIFQRLEISNNFTENNGLFYNYNGLTSFTSNLNKKVATFANNVGFTSYNGMVSYNQGNTPIIDSILGIRYKLTPYGEVDIYKKLDTYEYALGSGLLFNLKTIEGNVYENSYALNLGYMVNDRVISYGKEFENLRKYNNFEYQNVLFKTMVDSDRDYLKEYELVNENNNNYEFYINNDNTIYFYLPCNINNDNDSSIQVYINDELITTYNSNSKGVILIKNLYKNSKINIRYEINGGVEILSSPCLYYLDNDNFEKDINLLKKHQLEIDKFSDTYIKGKVNSINDNNILFLSIPYDESWTVYVDGKKSNKEIIFDTFIGVKLDSGDHVIELKYEAKGLKTGIIISFISLIITIFYLKKIKNINYNREDI